MSVEESASQSSRIHALRAPAEVRDHRAIPVMMQVMGEDSALLQHWAIEDRLSFHSYQLHCPRHSLMKLSSRSLVQVVGGHSEYVLQRLFHVMDIPPHGGDASKIQTSNLPRFLMDGFASTSLTPQGGSQVGQSVLQRKSKNVLSSEQKLFGMQD